MLMVTWALKGKHFQLFFLILNHTNSSSTRDGNFYPKTHLGFYKYSTMRFLITHPNTKLSTYPYYI